MMLQAHVRFGIIIAVEALQRTIVEMADNVKPRPHNLQRTVLSLPTTAHRMGRLRAWFENSNEVRVGLIDSGTESACDRLTMSQSKGLG